MRERALAILDVILHLNLCMCVTGKLSLCWLFHWAVHQLENEFNKYVHFCTNWKADAVLEVPLYTAWAFTCLKKNKHEYDRLSCEIANFVWQVTLSLFPTLNAVTCSIVTPPPLQTFLPLTELLCWSKILYEESFVLASSEYKMLNL